MAETDLIFIYGASGHGKVVFDVAVSAGWKIGGFVDDQKAGTSLNGFPVCRYEEIKHQSIFFALGIGDNFVRNKLFKQLSNDGKQFPELIHSSAVISTTACVSPGSVVMPNAVINADAFIGEGCIVNTAAIIEHDNHIAAFSHISPNAALSGGVSVGTHSHVGTGACVIPNIHIGSSVIVGAGSVVVKDVSDGVVIVGNPARKIR